MEKYKRINKPLPDGNVDPSRDAGKRRRLRKEGDRKKAEIGNRVAARRIKQIPTDGHANQNYVKHPVRAAGRYFLPSSETDFKGRDGMLSPPGNANGNEHYNCQPDGLMESEE